jgi:hypothetical protein
MRSLIWSIAIPFGVLPFGDVELMAFLTVVVLLGAEQAGGLMSPLKFKPTQPFWAVGSALVEGLRN